MESAIRKLRVATYKGQLAVCEKVHEALSKELNNKALTDDERFVISRRCDEAVNQGYALRFLLDLMERFDRETKIGPA